MTTITSGTRKVIFPALISVIYIDNKMAVQIQRITAKEFDNINKTLRKGQCS